MSESKDLMKEAFVSFFFLGRAPVAPGTFGSFGSLILAYLIVENIVDYSGYLLLGLSAVFYYIGLQIAPWCEDKYGKDPGIYVVDEVIGYLVPISFLIIFGVDLTTKTWILSFISFEPEVKKDWLSSFIKFFTTSSSLMLTITVEKFFGFKLLSTTKRSPS